LKICDPAVGSGHFLVSALNEVIAIKAELGILADKEGLRLTGYEVKIENDELIVTYNDDTEIFEYSVTSNSIAKETQRVQKTLFHEKESIIENSLFGVDINPNSVKICRLRLWIELLKNAYYTEESKFTELETLPNIDINIKCGNSLISRFTLDSDLKKALKGKWNIDTYKIAVHSYHEAENKDEKRKLEELINTIKKDFRTEIGGNDPRRKKLSKLKEELFLITVSPKLELDIEMKKGGVKLEKEKVKKLTDEINKIEQELKDIENNKIYENAFEWRFEFPEVLDMDGKFIGFDVVIGNPPYGVSFNDSMKSYLNDNYAGIQQKMFDSFLFFISLSEKILKENGDTSYIVPNNLIYQMTFENARRFMLDKFVFRKAINMGDKVFLDADVPTCLYTAIKGNDKNYKFNYADLRNVQDKKELLHLDSYEQIEKANILETFALVFGVKDDNFKLLKKIGEGTTKLSELVENASYGIGSGGDKIFRLPAEECKTLKLEKEILHNVYSGSNIQRYYVKYEDEKIIYTTKEVDISKFPNILKHLTPHKVKLSTKRETKNGTLPWWCLHWPRNKDLYKGEKIVLRQTGDRITAALDLDSYFVMDSVMVLKLKSDSKYDSKYILALLNSKLFGFVYENIAMEKGRTFAQVKPQNIKQLPIKSADSKKVKKLVELVDKIRGKIGEDITSIENEINSIVYDIYGLNENDIKIIESN
jgi:hypothetical protein